MNSDLASLGKAHLNAVEFQPRQLYHKSLNQHTFRTLPRVSAFETPRLFTRHDKSRRLRKARSPRYPRTGQSWCFPRVLGSLKAGLLTACGWAPVRLWFGLERQTSAWVGQE